MRQTFCPALLLFLTSGRTHRYCVAYAYDLLRSRRSGLFIPLLLLATGCRYIDSARTQRKTACTVEEACLQLSCLAIDILLLSIIVCCEGMFTGPLPSNEL
jgi:hypothetical protein